VFAPDPADLVGRIVLVLRKPELAFLADDIEDLSTVRLDKRKWDEWNLLHRLDKSGKGTQPPTS
jgi:hypothetical protein